MARQWTDEEICRAIVLIKEGHPALWEQYIVGEIYTDRVDGDVARELYNFWHAGPALMWSAFGG